MRTRLVATLLLGSGLAACERESQKLPFSVENPEPTVKTISASEAATVSTPAGAAVHFESGSVSENTSVSLSAVTPPAALQQSGSVVSRGFELTPPGLALQKPGAVEVKFGAGGSADAWLASVVNLTPTGVQEIGDTRLDLRTGLAEAGIGQLGTLAVVLPDPQAVVRAQRVSASRSSAPVSAELLPLGTDSVGIRCGGPGNRCVGLSVTASESLLDKVAEAAAVFPRVEGMIRIHGAQASGGIRLATAVRVLLASRASAENVGLHALVEPTAGTVVTETASEITLSNVRFRIGGGTEEASASQEFVGVLVISKGESAGSITISRSFDIRNASNQAENASVSVTVPVQIYQ